jgi:nitroreductase
MDAFNDRSSPLSLLRTRRSGKAREMIAPGPDAAQLADMLALAARVPDHGKLTPWRFVVVPETARGALADLIEAAYRAEKPAAARLEIEAMRGFAVQAPSLVVLLSHPVTSHIPPWEQELSVGAVALNLMHAAHAMGFVANWLTGWAAFSPAVASALGEPGERIAGFFFIGTQGKPLEERPRPDMAQVVRVWQG